MGLPVERLVLATNENDVLDEFFRSGRYRVRSAAETHATSSPSMDISKASNFERYVVRHRRPRRRTGAQPVGGARGAGRFRPRGTPHWDAVRASASFPAAAPTPTGWPPFAGCTRASGLVIDRTPPTG